MSTPPRSTAWAPSSQDLQGGCAPDGLRRGLAPRADADTNPSAIEPLSADQLGANGYTGSVNGRSVEAKPSSENHLLITTHSRLDPCFAETIESVRPQAAHRTPSPGSGAPLGRVLPQPLGRPGRRRGERGAAGARALAGLQARVWHLRPRLHVAPRVPVL